jgi:hypothetical protein
MIAVVVAIHVGDLKVCLVDRGFESHSASGAGASAGEKGLSARSIAQETDIVRRIDGNWEDEWTRSGRDRERDGMNAVHNLCQRLIRGHTEAPARFKNRAGLAKELNAEAAY